MYYVYKEKDGVRITKNKAGDAGLIGEVETIDEAVALVSED